MSEIQIAEIWQYMQEIGRLKERLAVVEAKAGFFDEMREALNKYGEHVKNCNGAFAHLPCRCGLREIRERADKIAEAPK